MTRNSAGSAPDAALPHRPERVDARLNRRRLIDAATEAFAEAGLSASAGDIAKRAGLGKGTLFRRFGDKENLLAAVACHWLLEVAEMGEGLLEQENAGEALHSFMRMGVHRQLSDRGLFEAIGGLALINPEVQQAKAEVIRAVDALLRKAQADGSVRQDLTTLDVMLLVTAISHAAAPLHANAPSLWLRYCHIVFDGMRPDAATSCDVAPPTAAQLSEVFGVCPWNTDSPASACPGDGAVEVLPPAE